MSIVSSLTGTLYQPPPYPVRKFSVGEYHQMIQMGLLTEDDPVELLEGWIVPKMPRNTPHDVCIDKTQEALRLRLPAGWRLRIQSAITLIDSEPEPDCVVALGPADRYLAHHPWPSDIALLIEVSDSSLLRDRQDKGRIYARAGIAVYWIVNLIDGRVEVYADPTGPDPAPTYRQHLDYSANDAVPLLIDGRDVGPIAVRDLLP